MNQDDLRFLLREIAALRKRLERLEVQEAGSGGGVTDHGLLTGLDDDDHAQYLNVSRHDATARHPLGTVVPHDDHGLLSGLSDDDHTQYLNASRHDTTSRHTLGTVVPHDDHGLLTGLGDDDHAQYVKKAASSTDNAIARFDGTTGRVLQNSGPTIDDNGSLSLPSSADLSLKGYKLGSWASWTPSYYAGWSSLPGGTYNYCVIGSLLIFVIDMTSGTSNATNAVIGLPVTVKNNQVFGGACGLAYDNGVLLTAAARWYVDNLVSRVQFHKDMGTGAWTASGTKRIRCVGFAEV